MQANAVSLLGILVVVLAGCSSYDDEYAVLQPIIDEVRPALTQGQPVTLVMPLSGPYLVVHVGGPGVSRWLQDRKHGFVNTAVFGRLEDLKDLKTLILIDDAVMSTASYRRVGQPNITGTRRRYIYHLWAVDIATRTVSLYGSLSDAPAPQHTSSRESGLRIYPGDVYDWADSVFARPDPRN